MIRLPFLVISGVGIAAWMVLVGFCKVLHIAFTFIALGIVFMFMMWRRN